MMSLVDNLRRWLRQRCTLCGAPETHAASLCAGCHRDLPWLGASCANCALPLPAEGLCRACSSRPPPFDSVRSAFRYATPVDGWILGLKFHGRLAHARTLGELMAGRLATGGAPLPQLLLPVPLHARRLRMRGYNQALELARVLSRRLGIALDATAAARVRTTAEQTRLSAVERRRNLRGAFKARRDLSGLRIAVVDDVMTTGATAAELARTLRKAGASHIEVWTAARA